MPKSQSQLSPQMRGNSILLVQEKRRLPFVLALQNWASIGISRPLYYYVKEQHLGVVAGIEEYVRTFDKMMVPDGPLSDMGLIPLQ